MWNKYHEWKDFDFFRLWRSCVDKRMIGDFKKTKSCWKSLGEVGEKMLFFEDFGWIKARERKWFFESF